MKSVRKKVRNNEPTHQNKKEGREREKGNKTKSKIMKNVIERKGERKKKNHVKTEINRKFG